MAYRVAFSREALEYLRSIPRKHQTQLINKADTLALNQFPPGCKALQGKFKGMHRIRSGDYRIVYQVRGDVLLVLVVKIGLRRIVYR